MAEWVAFRGITLLNEEGRSVFQDLDWSLATGTRIHLRGAAGSGTTALLRLSAGLAHPQAGTVWLEDVKLGPYAFDHPFLKQGGVGWVPTEGGLQANLSLAANLALPLRFLRGRSQAEADAMALQALVEAGLDSHAALRPHALEPRERWLGALIRAALSRPRLWLVDRPPGAVDATLRGLAHGILRQAARDPEVSILVVGPIGEGLGWNEFHLEAGRLVPGGD